MSSISSIGDIARVHAANNADKVALIYQERQWTYGQLDKESNRVANALLAAGVNPQDRVVHLDKNGPEYFTYLIGASKVKRCQHVRQTGGWLFQKWSTC